MGIFSLRYDPLRGSYTRSVISCCPSERDQIRAVGRCDKIGCHVGNANLFELETDLVVW